MFLFFEIGENKKKTQNLNELLFQILEMIRNFFSYLCFFKIYSPRRNWILTTYNFWNVYRRNRRNKGIKKLR